MIWNGRWPTRNKTAWMHLSSNKKGSEKLGLLAIAWDKRMWVSRPKFSWQFLILSLCASGSWWLLAGGGDLVWLRSMERTAVSTPSACTLIWHGITSYMKRKHVGGMGQLCRWNPQDKCPGGTTSHHASQCLFTAPTAWPGQLSHGRWG